MKKFFADFKKFISRGNILDLAVGMIIGAAFTAIVNSLVKQILMPIISLIPGIGSFQKMGVVLNGVPMYLEDGTLNPAANVLWYGEFIYAVINFLITAFILFLIVKLLMKMQGFLTPKYYGFSRADYIAMRKEGKTKEQIEALGKMRDEEEAAKKKAEEEEAKKHTTEALLEDIKALLLQLTPEAEPLKEETEEKIAEEENSAEKTEE